MDGLNSDILMPTKVPLNRYIIRYEILKVDLRTSREPVRGQIQDPDPGPSIQYPVSRIQDPDPSISDLRIIH